MYTIRKLTNRDLLTVVGMLKKLVAAGTGDDIAGLFVPAVGDSPKEGEAKDPTIRLGFIVLTKLFDNLFDDFVKWIASLLGMPYEEYLELPPESTLDIIDQLVEGEDSKRFFKRAWELSRKMQAFGKIFGTGSKVTDAISGLPGGTSTTSDSVISSNIQIS